MSFSLRKAIKKITNNKAVRGIATVGAIGAGIYYGRQAMNQPIGGAIAPVQIMHNNAMGSSLPGIAAQLYNPPALLQTPPTYQPQPLPGAPEGVMGVLYDPLTPEELPKRTIIQKIGNWFRTGVFQ